MGEGLTPADAGAGACIWVRGDVSLGLNWLQGSGLLRRQYFEEDPSYYVCDDLRASRCCR